MNKVKNPKHYLMIPELGVQTIHMIKAALTEEEFRGYCKGNMMKYLSRSHKKGTSGEDDAKALMYSQFMGGVLPPFSDEPVKKPVTKRNKRVPKNKISRISAKDLATSISKTIDSLTANTPLRNLSTLNKDYADAPAHMRAAAIRQAKKMIQVNSISGRTIIARVKK